MTERQAAQRIRSTPPQNVSVEMWLCGYRVFFPSERKPETAAHDDLMLQPFIRAHGRKLLSAITPIMAQDWANKNPSQLRYLRSAFQKAVQLELLRVNVWLCVQLPRNGKQHRPVPSLEQVDAAVARCREIGGWYPEFADIIEFCAFTGARGGGMARLTAADVDLDAGRVRLTEKGDKTRRVVLAPRARLALERAMDRCEIRVFTDLLFLSPARKPMMRDAWGLGWRTVRGDFDGPFHALKHFAGTWLASLGVDERDIAVQLGHTDSQGRPYTELVRRVYVHPDHGQALARIEAAVV